jgi:hypothetical protein
MKSHLERKTLCEPTLSKKIPTDCKKEIFEKKKENKLKCKHCLVEFSRSDSRKRHEEKCKTEKEDSTVQALKELVATLNQNLKHEKEVRKQDREEMKELKTLVKKAGISQNVTNFNTQNITIILPFKETDVSHLSGRDYYKALSRCVLSIPQLISDTHFNPNKPENHNIYISNLSRGHAMVYDGSKWILKNQTEVIENLIEENEYRLEDWVSEGSKKYPKAMDKFEKYVEKRDEKGVPELIRKEIKMMLYNNRTMIKELDDTQEVD